MAQPVAIRIGAAYYQVVLEDRPRGSEGEELCGDIDYTTCTIRLNERLAPDAKAQTLLHEVLHGINETMALKQREREIDAMAHGLLQVIRDNPDLLAYLVSP